MKANVDSYNQRLVASASTRQYESATLPAKQLRNELPDAPFSEKHQRQSRYDGGVEEDGVTRRPLVPLQPAEPLMHAARERRRRDSERREPHSEYKELPLTGCQLCNRPHYLLPHSFGQQCVLGSQGDVEHGDVSQLAGLPWVFDTSTGELSYFLVDVLDKPAARGDFHSDAIVFEQCFGLDVRFLHNHNHDHECSGTCVKNVKKKTAQDLAKRLRSNRAPPCRGFCTHT